MSVFDVKKVCECETEKAIGMPKILRLTNDRAERRAEKGRNHGSDTIHNHGFANGELFRK